MIRYKMYERELTQGGSYQYHTCVDKLDEYDIDLYDYEINDGSRITSWCHQLLTWLWC